MLTTSDGSLTINSVTAARRNTATDEVGIRRLLDTELADALVGKLKELRSRNLPLGAALKSDRELNIILDEFRRRASAHSKARGRYRDRLRRGGDAA
jgi:hypothetical protein